MTNLDSTLKSRDITLPAKGSYSQRCGFSSSHVWLWELDHKQDWALVLQKTLESPLDSKEIEPVSPKGSQPWILSGTTDWCWSTKTLVTRCEEPTHWIRPWCWERLKAIGEGDCKGWDGWMASLTEWTWIWANSGRQWKTEESVLLQSMGSQRVWRNLVTEQHNNRMQWAKWRMNESSHNTWMTDNM